MTLKWQASHDRQVIDHNQAAGSNCSVSTLRHNLRKQLKQLLQRDETGHCIVLDYLSTRGSPVLFSEHKRSRSPQAQFSQGSKGGLCSRPTKSLIQLPTVYRTACRVYGRQSASFSALNEKACTVQAFSFKALKLADSHIPCRTNLNDAVREATWIDSLALVRIESNFPCLRILRCCVPSLMVLMVHQNITSGPTWQMACHDTFAPF